MVSRAGSIVTLHRAPPLSAAAVGSADAEDKRVSLQPDTHPAGQRSNHVSAKLVHTESLEDRNVRELASVIWTEARGIGDDAMTAVGWTLRNRMIRCGIDQVDKAWHGYTHGTQPRGADLAHAEDVAKSVLDGKKPDPTGGATHFYTPQAMPKEDDTNLDGTDIDGGLESVPGVTRNGKAVRNYRPGWATKFTRESVKSVPEASFKFYRPLEDGPTF